MLAHVINSPSPSSDPLSSPNHDHHPPHLKGAGLDFADDPFIFFSDDDDDNFWMSAQSNHQPHDAAYWMHAAHARQFPQQQFSAQPDYYSYNQQSSGFSKEWQQGFGGDAFSPYSISQTSPQSKLRQHRRALSNSTITSQASTASPQQPAPLYGGGGLLDPSQARSSFQHQYYPTPTHTPTQDTFMERSFSRRNRPDNTSAPAQISQAQGKQFPQQQQQQQQQQPTSAPQQYNVPYSQDYPATPSTTNGDYTDRRYNGPQYASQSTIPRLEPSMTQACADELYNPSVGVTLAQYPQHPQMNMLHPGGVQQRIQQAHEARSKSPIEPPKRETSPYVTGSREDPNSRFGQDQIRTASAQRLSQKWNDDQLQRWRHQTRGVEVVQQEPKTISPKDAYVDDFRDPAEESTSVAPLFPTGSTSSQQLFDDNGYRSNYGMDGNFPSTTFSFQAPSIPASANHPSSGDFKFAPLSRNESSNSDTPAHLISMETSKSDEQSSQEYPPAQPQHRPVPRSSNTISALDTGTYSCTYAGCPQRFATPALLQRHKRDAHRPSGGTGLASRPTTESPLPDGGSGSASPGTPLNRNSQAGPHRCDRINPSTGKPCNTVFSRPYDLTRHEDTIHARRPKVSCHYCAERGEEKTFSRADALTRHLRVVHPEVEVYGKSGRRRGL